MIPARVHAALDGLSVAALLAGSTRSSLPRSVRSGLALAGAGVAAYSLTTRYTEPGRRPLDLRRHLALDAVQGAGFCAAAAVMRRASPDARTSLAGYGLFSIAAAALTDRPVRAERVGRQVPLTSAAVVGASRRTRTVEVAPDVAYRRLGIVNVVFLGARGAEDRDWVLIDAGLSGTASVIAAAAAERFGAARPAAIVLTHGHFDHVGALATLAEQWDVPVYAHPDEHPFLSGAAAYPPGDPGVGGGAMAALGGLYPTGPVDVSHRLMALPDDGRLPGAAGWRWLHTPGHSPGHVSLWRDRDRALVAGDAIVTTRQESAYSVARQAPEIHGPPAYFTTDWGAAGASVARLAALEADVVVSGHGPALAGDSMRAALRRLAGDFEATAVPYGTRYAPRAPTPAAPR